MHLRVVAAVLLLAAGCAAEPERRPSGEPVKIGYLNNASGAFAVPELQIGAEVAVAHLNGKGGIRNRRIELVTCPTDGTPEQSRACAGKFVSEKAAVVVQGVDTGADAAMPDLVAAPPCCSTGSSRTGRSRPSSPTSSRSPSWDEGKMSN